MVIRGKASEVLAYAAGFIDGEGYIGITRSQPKATWKGRSKSPRYEYFVVVVNTNEAVMRWFQEQFGGSLHLKSEHKNHPTWLPKWHWNISSFQASELCEELLPYLKVKRPQAEVLVEFRHGKTAQRVGGRGGGKVTAPEEIAWRESMYQRIKGLRKVQPQRLTEKTPADAG